MTTSLRNLPRAIQKAQAQARRNMVKTMAKESKKIFDKTQLVVPVDTGELQRSGKTLTSVISEGKVTTDFIYTAGHSVAVHEGTTRMPKRQFVKEPLFESASEVADAIAAAGVEPFGKI